MSNCPASVCPSTFFSNWICSLSLHPIFPIFGVNMHNTIAQNMCFGACPFFSQITNPPNRDFPASTTYMVDPNPCLAPNSLTSSMTFEWCHWGNILHILNAWIYREISLPWNGVGWILPISSEIIGPLSGLINIPARWDLSLSTPLMDKCKV